MRKQKTRKTISDIATRMFMEKGYDSVTMADVAVAAEVSLSTVFNYFPKKETLVFDIADELSIEIAGAVRERGKGESILDGLNRYFLASKDFNPPKKKVSSDFMRLVRSSPELSAYFRTMLTRYEGVLSKEIQKEAEVSKLEAECVAKLILEGVNFAWHSNSREEALNLMFKVLKKGWNV